MDIITVYNIIRVYEIILYYYIARNDVTADKTRKMLCARYVCIIMCYIITL